MERKEPWMTHWDEAREQLAVAQELQAGSHHSSAVFHSLMALELAAKAVRLAPVRWRDLENTSWGELRTYTWGQLEQGLAPMRGHVAEDVLDAPWHPRSELGRPREVIAEIEAELGLASNTLYAASRYPDRWPDFGAPPYQRIHLEHADRLLQAVSQFFEVCRLRVET